MPLNQRISNWIKFAARGAVPIMLAVGGWFAATGRRWAKEAGDAEAESDAGGAIGATGHGPGESVEPSPPDGPTGGRLSPRARARVHIAVLMALPALVFANTLYNGYQLDDTYQVSDNPEIERVWPPWRHFLDPATGSTLPHNVQYRPLRTLAYSLNVAVTGALGLDRLAGFHIGNIVFHLASTVLLYLLFCELLLHRSRLTLGRDRLRDLAFLAALIFAVHPVSGAPVNYISALDLLMMMFFLTASLLVYARMRRLGETAGGWCAVVVLLMLSLLSKTNSVVAFALIFLFEFLLADQRLRDWRPWARIGAVGAVSAVFFAWTEIALAFSDAGNLLSARASIFEYPLTQLKVHLFHYLRNFAWPFQMRALPRIEAVESFLDPRALIAGAFILGSLFLAWFWRQRNPLLAFSILAYWVLLSLTSSVFPLHQFAYDYRPYPSLAFLCLALAIAFHPLLRHRAGIVAIVALVVYFAASAFHLNAVWRTEESLWAQSVRYGGTSMAHMNYALAVAAKDPAGAERHYREALRLGPGNVYAHINLGLFYISRNRRQEGLALVRKAVDLAPDWALTHYWLSSALGLFKREREARAELRRAADLDRRNLAYQYRAARALQIAGDAAASLVYIERLTGIDPDYRDTQFLLGWAHQSAGRGPPAIEAYRRFLSGNPDHVQARFNLGFALKETGDCRAAVTQFERVLALDAARTPAHAHLATCYRALGDGARAAAHQATYDRNKR